MDAQQLNTEALKQAADRLREKLPPVRPACALILGSGWSVVSDDMTERVTINYAEIPGLGAPRVEGHPGRVLVGRLEDTDVLVFEGRRHWYEGSGWQPIAFPVCLTLTIEIPILLLTNAAGGIRSDLNVGDLMVIDDHINAMGVNPLVGPHHSLWGTRFADQTCVYDKGLRLRLDQAARSRHIPLAHGIYAATSGPAYETPAEISALRTLGADAVGMSTVPEAILAHAAGLRVAGLSCITNKAAGLGNGRLTHREVMRESMKVRHRMRALLQAFLKDAATAPSG